MGVINAVVTNYDGRHYSKVMKGFNRVLLDEQGKPIRDDDGNFIPYNPPKKVIH